MLLSLLLCSMNTLILASLSNSDHEPAGDTNTLQVIINNNQPVLAVLGGSLTLPCLVSLPEPLPSTFTLGRHAALILPRIKWSLRSSGQETEIVVAQGDLVKVSKVYKGRASLPYYTSSPANLTLQLEGLRHSDSGIYCCKVQQGLEDAHDLAPVKVKGVVFHYRHASGHNAFSFREAQKACRNAGAHVATPEQLGAAYHSGLEQCHAGWLSDQTVGYAVQHPSQACFGDMEGDPGMRNYGKLYSQKRYDVYCYVEDIPGKVVYNSSPLHLTLEEAKAYCGSCGAKLATLGQLYAAWSDGLHRCSPGWLADGSVRYPVVTPTEHCGGSKPGIRTVYRYHNQTGFPEPHSRHDVYCFQDNRRPQTDTSREYMAADSESVDQDSLLKDPLEDFSLGQILEQEKSEPDGVMEVFPVFESSVAATQMMEQGTIQEIFPVDNIQVDISVPLDSQNPTTPKATSQTKQFKEVLSSVQKARDPEHYHPKPEISLNSNVTIPSSENSGNNLKSETVLETNGPTVSPRDTGVSITHPLMSETNKSRDLFSLSGGSGGSHGRYHPLSEKNRESIDPETSAGNNQQYDKSNTNLDTSISSLSYNESKGFKHYPPVTGTNLVTSDLSKSHYDILESRSGSEMVFDNSEDNSSFSNASVTAHLEIGTVTPPLSSSEEPGTSMSPASPTSWYDIPPGENNHGKGKLAKISETSTSASTPHGDWDLHSELPTPSSEWNATTPYSPLNQTEVSIPSLSPSGSVVTWSDVEVRSGKKNAPVSEKLKDLVTLEPLDIDLIVPSEDIHTSAHSSSTLIPQVSGSTQQQSGIWPDSGSSEEKQVEQEAVGTSVPPSVGDPTGPAGLGSPTYPSITFDPIHPYAQGRAENDTASPFPVGQEKIETLGESLESSVEGSFGSAVTSDEMQTSQMNRSADISSGVDSTQQQSGIGWTDFSTPVEDTGASGQQWVEMSFGSGDLGSISDLGLISVDMESVSSVSSGDGSSEFSGDQEMLRPGGFPVTLMTSPAPFTLPGPSSPFGAAEVEASGPSYIHLPEVVISPELENSGMEQTEQEEFSETHDVTFPAVTCTDEKLSSQEGVTVRGHSEMTSVEFLGPSAEPEQLLPSTYSPGEASEINQDTTITELPESPFPSTTIAPTTDYTDEPYEATPAVSMSHRSIGPMATGESTLYPDSTQSPSWGIEASSTILQESHTKAKYIPKHPSVTQVFEPEFSSITSGYPTRSITTPSALESQKSYASAGPVDSVSPEEDIFQHFTASSPLEDTEQPEIKVVLTQPSTFPTLPKEKATVGGGGSTSGACLENPCINGGTCVEEGGSSGCLCLPTYGGDFCQTDLEPCEVGWEKFQGFCYRHFTDRQGWEVAEQQCRTYGGHLASVMSPEEQDFINNNYKEYQWTGLNDKTLEGDFRWSDGNPLLYENWYNGQPDSYFLSGEDCVVMVWHDGGRWSDVPCNYHLSYTCKKGTSSCGEPPGVPNARVFSKLRQRYETGSMVRYYCTEGFLQRHDPVIKCLPSGQWEEPQVTCVPVLGDPAGHQQVMTPFTQSEEEALEDTAKEKVTPEFWDIKWNF